MSKEVDILDLLEMAKDNVYNTEYTHKINISCRDCTYKLFKEIKERMRVELGLKATNAQVFEFMCVEMYNSINHKSYK